jgi:hypothetical protein
MCGRPIVPLAVDLELGGSTLGADVARSNLDRTEWSIMRSDPTPVIDIEKNTLDKTAPRASVLNPDPILVPQAIIALLWRTPLVHRPWPIPLAVRIESAGPGLPSDMPTG